LKQELIKKQRADKEKDDTDKSENNSPRDIAPVSKIGMKLSEKSEEIQMKMDKLKADILKNQAAKDEDELNIKKGKEQRISRTKSFSDDSSSSSEDEGEKKGEIKVVEKAKIEVKGKGEKKEDLESVDDYDSDEQNDIDERNFNQKILDKNKIMNNNVNTSLNTTVNTGVNKNKKTNSTSAIRGSIISKRGSASSDILGFDDQSLERSLDSIHAFDSASHDHLEEDLDRLDFLSQSSGSVTDSKDRGKSFFGRMTKIMKNVGKKSDDSGTSSPAVKGSSSGTFKPYRQRAGSSIGSKDSDTDSLHLEKHQGQKTSDKAGGSFFSRLAGKKSNDKKSTAKDISPVAERNLDDSLDGGSI
jgi:hypothetical protein